MSTHHRESLVKRFYQVCEDYPSISAIMHKDEAGNYIHLSYKELARDCENVAAFLLSTCKVSHSDHIALICDNRYEWVSLDLGIQSLGAVNVPRGADTPIAEVAYIIEHSDSQGCILENINLYKELENTDRKLLSKMKFIILIESPDKPQDIKKLYKQTYLYKDIISHTHTQKVIDKVRQSVKELSADDRATIIYTSGTTSKPKGVCLTQSAFEVQVDKIRNVLPVDPAIVFMSILPIWHAYARAIQYVILCFGATVAYSKPLGKILLEDLQKVNTRYLPSVPRVWEGVYNGVYRKVRAGSPVKRAIFHSAVVVGSAHSKLYDMLIWNNTNFHLQIKPLNSILALIPFILLYPLRTLLDLLVFKTIRAKLGNKNLIGVSGGGALPKHVDNFFQAAKIKVLEGYGLTETAPVLAVRSLRHPEMHTIGKLFPDIEYKIITKEGKVAKHGESGVLYVRGNQTMQGYYKNEDATREVLSEDGWLNTGDLVRQARNKSLKIIGRAKDTIVLSNGENVEPDRVETLLTKSPLIDFVMVFGQDKKTLSALIVPNKEELLHLAEKSNFNQDIDALCKDDGIRLIYQNTISNLSQKLNSFERIQNFVLIPEEFEVGQELTQTLKIKRNFVSEKYKKHIAQCYKTH